MKKLLTTILVIVSGFSLLGCGGGVNLDRTFTIPDSNITFNVSSSWVQETKEYTSFTTYDFLADNVYIFVRYYPEKEIDAFEEQESRLNSYRDLFNCSDVMNISQEESVIDGARVVIFEYTYTEPYIDVGIMFGRIAILTRSGSSVTIDYQSQEDYYNPAYFEAVLQSLRWA